jgi:hypothetical protein
VGELVPYVRGYLDVSVAGGLERKLERPKCSDGSVLVLSSQLYVPRDIAKSLCDMQICLVELQGTAIPPLFASSL